MAGYMNEPWGYCERSGFKVPLRKLVRDGEKNIWCEKGWADRRHPQRELRPVGPDHQKVEPVTAGENGETWTSAIGPLTVATTSTGFANDAIRNVIAANTLTATGTYVRLKLTAPASAPVRVTACWIGAGDLVTPYQYAATPNQLRYGGSDSFVIPAGMTVATDRIKLTLARTAPVVIALDVQTDAIATGAQTSSFSRYVKDAAREAWSVTVSGYTLTVSSIALVSALEVIS